jgi:CDP-glycerol glycerophosphotransferase (TagB/SpsB family)
MSTQKKIINRTAKLFLAWFLDWLVPVRPKQIIFVTRANVPLAGNLRVMLDAFSGMPGYSVYLFKEKGEIPKLTLRTIKTQGVHVIQGFGFKVLWKIFSSQLVVLSHSARDAYITHQKPGRRVFNLWHGVALKKIENLMPLRGNLFQNWYRRSLIKRNGRIYDGVIASSYVDRLVNSLAFGLPLEKVYPVGLPRFEYFQSSYSWPSDLQAQRQKLIEKLRGRKLIMYAPTFRDNGTTLNQLMPINALMLINDFCKKNDLVFGIRPHPYRTHELTSICDGDRLVDLSAEIYPESAVLLERAQALIVDYSSIWVDFLYLKRPLLAFIPDIDAYIESDRGFIHDFPFVFPGATCAAWLEILNALAPQLNSSLATADEAGHEYAVRMFLPATSKKSGQIVADCIRVITSS